MGLLRQFLQSVSTKGFFRRHTRVHITLKNCCPYDRWNVTGIAEECGWIHVRTFPFPLDFFSGHGYQPKVTKRRQTLEGVPIEQIPHADHAKTYEFLHASVTT